VFAATTKGLWVTRDHGQTWNVLSSGALTATSTVDAVAVPPTYGSDHAVLTSVRGRGLFRSTNGGSTFSAVGTALIAANHSVLDFENPTSFPIQYSPTYATDHTVFAFGGVDVMKSTDSGVTWAVTALPPGSAILAPPAIATPTTRASVLEGGPGTTTTLAVPFDLAHPYASTVTVKWHTVDKSGTAYATAASGDFVAASGTLVFAPGATRAFATVTVNGDSVHEFNELLVVAISNPTNATIGATTGAGIITNDD
jgi:hypothetical protein